ncbi:helix-turn-helix domain-containing protein [Kitasatospora sp. NPDC018619]|uniref:AraC-like ligand-binding domain-containing protein n=1 Tax=unclassified Kitasatospora TaxID=2633591 RepID=UPI00378D291F
MYTQFDTAGLPSCQRFEWWREAVGHGVAPVEITTEAVGFEGSVGSLPLGRAHLTTMRFSQLRSDRTAALVRQGDPETYELALVLGGSMTVSQGRSEARLVAGDFALWSSSHPYRGDAAGSVGGPDEGPSRAIVLHLPRALVPVPEAKVGALLARTLPAAAGMGRILAQHLASVAGEAHLLTEQDCARLGVVSLDLAAGFLAERADAAARLPAETRHQLLLSRIDVFLRDNLACPGLGPAAVAAHHHISVRLLHQLFRERGETVSASIRRGRLERCRADLADPSLWHVTVREIAMRWGMGNPAGFNRAFRAAYGTTPGEYRRSASAAPSDNTSCAGRQ